MRAPARDWTYHRMTSQGFYKLDVPEKLNMARICVDWWVEEGGRGDDVAIYHRDQKITYRQLKEQIDSLAAALYKLGLRQPDRYLLRTPNCTEYMVAFLAGQKIGAVPIPTNPMLREYELVHIVNNSEAVAAFATPDLVDSIEKIKPQCPTLKYILVIGEDSKGHLSYEHMWKEQAGQGPPFIDTHKDDPAYYLYTSGTTAGPKGVVHAHRFIIGAGDPIGKSTMNLQRGDITSGPTALTWMYALGHNFLFAFRWGTSVAIWMEPRFDAEKAFEFAAKYKLTHFVGTPTIYRRMLAVTEAETRYDLRSLKYFLSSGEPLLERTARELTRRFGVRCLDCMGQTEAHEFCTSQTDLPVKIGSMGKPLPGIEAAIVDDRGNIMEPGEVGHLAIRRDHPGLLVEYFKQPEVLTDVTLPNNWYDTKDLACMDEDGYFWYISRSDDIITSRGYRISPAEVETALQKHPAVLESGVAGAFDSNVGEKVKAWIVLQKGYKPSPELAAELMQHVKDVIAPYKHPQEVEFVSELPKTSSDKILRRELRRIEREKHGVFEPEKKKAFVAGRT